MDLTHFRLHNQRIASNRFDNPAEVVSWLGAVQAQDYLGALWAVGLRMSGASEAAVERALADRSIVRTWPMRGTLHFVAASDVRWMLELMTPRIVAANARRLKQQMDLDDAVFDRCREVFGRLLHGGKQLPRNAMYQAVEEAGISTAGQRGLHILWRLSQDGFICFGAREGKQQSFALLEEWVPNARRLERNEALAELTRRYFNSHGPATVHDFVWWSGLTAADVRAGLEMVRSLLENETVDGRTYWFSPTVSTRRTPAPTAFLLPNYDEYIVGYKDRSAAFDPSSNKHVNLGNIVFNPTVVIDGAVVGTWKRILTKSSVVIEAAFVSTPSETERRAFIQAARRYSEFLGLPAVIA